MNVSLEEYFRTTFEDKLLVKMPEREDDHLTAATRLLEKRREMQEVEQALAAQKEEFQMKMESLQQRREELERKEYQLKESLLKFDKFLKENDAKRARALKKAGDEREYKRQKEKEIERLKEDTGSFAKVKEKLQKKIDQYVVYHKYLEKVIETSEEFNEIREVIDRYETLTGNEQDLKTRELKNLNGIEGHKQHMNRYLEIKNNEILSQNNQLAGLQSNLDKAQSDAVKWESEWNHIKNTAAEQTLNMGRIKMATHNLYLLVNRHQRQLGDVALDDTNEQLGRIRTFIQDLTQITNEIKRETALATSQAGASSS